MEFLVIFFFCCCSLSTCVQPTRAFDDVRLLLASSRSLHPESHKSHKFFLFRRFSARSVFTRPILSVALALFSFIPVFISSPSPLSLSPPRCCCCCLTSFYFNIIYMMLMMMGEVQAPSRQRELHPTTGSRDSRRRGGGLSQAVTR